MQTVRSVPKRASSTSDKKGEDMFLPPAPVAWFRRTHAAAPTGAHRWPEVEPRPQTFVPHGRGAPSSRRLLGFVPVFLLLAALVAHGSAEALHGQMLRWGEMLWPGYAGLRTAAGPPLCTPDTEAPGTAGGAAAHALDDLLGAEDNAPSAAATAAAAQACAAAQASYAARQAALTPALRTFRSVERAVDTLFEWGVLSLRPLLVGLLWLCAALATGRRHHISLRPAVNAAQVRLAAGAQAVAMLFLGLSWWHIARTAGEFLPWLWVAGAGAVGGTAAVQGVWPRAPAGRLGWGAGAAVPLYALMVTGAGAYFVFGEQHPAGLAIHLQQLTEHALLYAHVALYVWVGMLLKQTRLADRCFATLRPLQLRPELLATVVVAAAAVPTAYSGASGIFVMAAGATIYQELRRSGASDRMAMAATAMSGSLGVVLSPCLLVVIAASLNKQVSTAALYGWGRWVFVLTAALYGVASLWLGRHRRMPPRPALAQRLGGSARMLAGLAAPVCVGAAGLIMYRGVLGMRLDEHTAPVILPVLLGVWLLWERHTRGALGPRGATRMALEEATQEASGHIGALLVLMAGSVCVGGMVARSGVMDAVPLLFSSPTVAMAALVAALVGVGMCMDPYGAVILVSASIAEVAYRNGIAPVHFWMVVLVAFELGYLMPPIALNQLLARRVVAAARVSQEAPQESWAQRHLDVLLPLGVMGSALLLVAFVPLLWPR